MKPIIIYGPTGVGKTDISLKLAKKYNAEIISCDSMQIYKYLDVGTAKISKNEMQGIQHHLIDFVEPNENYSVYQFVSDCKQIMEDIKKRNKNIVIVGGTGLYINAVLYDYKFPSRANEEYEGLSNDELYQMLLSVDPNTNIHLNNRVRVINALNYYKANKKPYSEKEKDLTLLYDTIFIGLTTDRDILYYKINKRVDKMVTEGLVEEAKEVYDLGIRSKAVMTPIGPKELFDYFDGKISLEEAIDLIKSKSRKYAKRQYTWFRNQMKLKWFETNYDDFSKTEEEVLAYIRKKISK